MTRACTLAAVRESLTAEQWERLLARNLHLRAPSRRRAPAASFVEAHAHRDGPRVTVVAKGLRLDATPNARAQLVGDGGSAPASARSSPRALAGSCRRGAVAGGHHARRAAADGRRQPHGRCVKGTRDAIAAWLGGTTETKSVAWEVRGRGRQLRGADHDRGRRVMDDELEVHR